MQGMRYPQLRAQLILVHYGSYNYAISKANYETEKGIIVIGYDEARAGEASLDVTLLTFAQVTVGVKDSSEKQ